MDGLRLALIIAGIVVVAAVYWWTARRRRMEREAGEFDRFDAWTDDSRDPLTDPVRPEPPSDALSDALSDDDSITQPNPNLVNSDLPSANSASSDSASSDSEFDAGDGGRSPAPLRDPAVLEGLEAIAESLDTRQEPSLGDVDEVADGDRARRLSSTEPSADSPSAAAAEPAAVPELVILINVMAPVGETFDGPPLREALENAGLRPGDLKLYHFRTEAQQQGSPPIFSALNMVKPGTLVPEQFAGMRTPGVAIVMRLPGPERPSEAFELMYGTATGIAAELGGRLCDESRSLLTRQALNHLREKIADLVRRQRAGG